MKSKNTGDKAMELSFPIMITLQEIRDHHPCKDGWTKVLAANGGASADMSKPFEMASIIDSNDLDDCLWALQCKPEYQHIYRRFSVLCADEVSHLAIDERSTRALDVAWLHSEGLATDEELAAVRDAAWDAAWDEAWAEARAAARDAARAAAWDAARDAAWAAAWAAVRDAAWDAAWGAAWAAVRAAAGAAAWDAAWDEARDAARAAAWDAAREYQSSILRHALTTGEMVRKCQKP